MSASPTLSNLSLDTVQDTASSPATSQYFNAADADVIFESSDHVRFHIHRKNLEAHARAFPPAEIKTDGEIVPLTEDSATLERLFHYVYPQRHPKINLLPSAGFFKLAEAAEKYEVFTLMDLCHMRMTQIFAQHPIEAFNHASKHDYPDVMDSASPLLLDIPLDKIVTQLDPNLVIPWVRYHQAWGSAAAKVTESSTTYCNKCGHSSFRHVCISLGQPLSRKTLMDKFGSFNCSYCSTPLRNDKNNGIISELEKALDTVPAFSTFM